MHQTAVQDTLNEEEGSQPVFHPRQNSFEGSDDENDENDGGNEDVATQNQVPRTVEAAGTPGTVAVAQRQNQVRCIYMYMIPVTMLCQHVL